MAKVHLILIDGMRPDALAACGDPEIPEFLRDCACTMEAVTVTPSVTLPCIMSLFHSVDPARHGITTNVYSPQVRPVPGICEQLSGSHRCGMVYNWEPLRDLSRPGSLVYSRFFAVRQDGVNPLAADALVAEASLRALGEERLDFLFTYLGATDELGHDHGWMSPEYLFSVRQALAHARRLIAASPEDTLTVILADHGGHERTHGTELPEDMRIPVILHGSGLRGRLRDGVSIKDIAPTVAGVLGVPCAREWEGHSLMG